MTQGLLYVFPEPLPLPKARGIQVMHSVVSLAEAGIPLTLAYVVANEHSQPRALFRHYGLSQPANLELWPLSRALPWPLSWLGLHSRRLFLWRLRRRLNVARQANKAPALLFTRHVKLASDLLKPCWPPLIYEAHELHAETALPHKATRLAMLEATVLKHAASLVAISNELANALKVRYELKRDFTIVPSAATLPQKTPQKRWNNAKTRIVYAGNAYPWKGVEDVLAAARRLPPECEIHLIGDLPRRYSTALSAPDITRGARLNLQGTLSHPDTLAFLQCACIAVLPNRAGSVSTYTSPLKLFEYMAAGCAIVASDLPVLREILGEKDAAWFAPGDPKSLASAIQTLLNNPESMQAMGKRVAERARDFSWEARAKRLQVICQHTLSQSATKSPGHSESLGAA